jgi:intracellular multiplication protein IcmO
MAQRTISGPQERFERSGPQRLRDIRPLSERLWQGLMGQASGAVLAMAAGIMWIEPASVHLLLPCTVLYFAIVMTRRTVLPMRLPVSAGVRDYNYPDPKNRQPRMAAGVFYLGQDLNKRELWITADDGRQHADVPGTTGAGKTSAILSCLVNALTHSSGFVYVDGKADNKLLAEVRAMARRLGREDDVRCLNFMVASGARQSNTFNLFGTGNAAAISEILISQLGDPTESNNQVFRDRAVALIGTVVRPLVWMRDHLGIRLTIEAIRRACELRAIWKLALEKKLEWKDPRTGTVRDLDVSGLPDDLVQSLNSYLNELPAYDPSVAWNQQKTDEPGKQHGFAVMYFTRTFDFLGSDLGHIFNCDESDIDMRDVLLNRRILVVNLPALEGSDERLPALGRIVIAVLRAMMAQMLGTRLEGDYGDIVANKPGAGAVPFHIVFDEMAYYATGGMDRMLAMGRGLNFMFWLGFQEVSGIWARLGEKTNSVLGNANLSIVMRLQDSDRTRQWVQNTASKTYVAEASGYEGEGGNYYDSKQVHMREVERIDWRDIQGLIEGEAMMIFGGRLIHAKVFYAGIDPSGPMRLNKTVTLPSLNRKKLVAECARVDNLIGILRRGGVALKPAIQKSLGLAAIVEAFAATAKGGGNADACVEASIEAAGKLLEQPKAKPDGPGSEFTPMLEAGAKGTKAPRRKTILSPEKLDQALLAAITRIEELSGVPKPEASEMAIALLSEREIALQALDKSGEKRGVRQSVENALTSIDEQLVKLDQDSDERAAPLAVEVERAPQVAGSAKP